jgi:hypothetical protein
MASWTRSGMVDEPTVRRAYEQLVNLETEMRETGIVYTSCPSGQHHDLGISLAMLAWAARHPIYRPESKTRISTGNHRDVRRLSAYPPWAGPDALIGGGPCAANS